ncbi:MAG TPA: tetratricopeptide repeat protein, partial [Verrucomicrobiae bacterium]|nr:tetratricopeptide repeat protein [Verrucomicrobiae bacterium]
FWPVNLANPYPYPAHWELSFVIFSVALVIGLSLAAIRLARKFPFAFTGWFWFIGTLIPVIGLVQVGDAAMADRYTYFPVIGIFIIFVWSAGLILANRIPKGLIIFFTAMLLGTCAFRARGQLNYWQNSGTLFSHTLAVTKNNYAAYIDLGTWLSSEGQIEAAIKCFHESLQIKPDNAGAPFYIGSALYNLGNALAKQGKWDEAIENYQRALNFTPNQADILDNLGFALAATKHFDAAITNFEAAIKLNPGYADAHNNLATVFFIEHQFAEAAEQYREAIRLDPGNASIYSNLADALIKMGQFGLAEQNYEQALRLNPGDARAKRKLQKLGVPVSN